MQKLLFPRRKHVKICHVSGLKNLDCSNHPLPVASSGVWPRASTENFLCTTDCRVYWTKQNPMGRSPGTLVHIRTGVFCTESSAGGALCIGLRFSSHKSKLQLAVHPRRIFVPHRNFAGCRSYCVKQYESVVCTMAYCSVLFGCQHWAVT